MTWHIQTSPCPPTQTPLISCVPLYPCAVFPPSPACITQTDPCGVQLFHLLEHTGGTGGVSLLVDGFYVASILRDLHPDAYRLLSTVPIPYHAAGESGNLYCAAHTPLEHEHEHDGGSTGGGAAGNGTGDGRGRGRNLRAVRWNNDDRSVLRSVPYADVPRLYEAMRVWDRLVTSQDSEFWVQLSPGSVLSMLRSPSFPPFFLSHFLDDMMREIGTS